MIWKILNRKGQNSYQHKSPIASVDSKWSRASVTEASLRQRKQYLSICVFDMRNTTVIINFDHIAFGGHTRSLYSPDNDLPDDCQFPVVDTVSIDNILSESAYPNSEQHVPHYEPVDDKRETPHKVLQTKSRSILKGFCMFNYLNNKYII